MKIRSVVLAAAAFALALGPYVAMAQQPSAMAELKNEAGKVVGLATFTQNLPDGGVSIQLRVVGLTSGVQAIHIHTVGNCTAPGFLSAGGHFNPEGRKHGFLNLEGAHAGDLPNLIVPASGSARYDAASYRTTLGPGPNTIFDADGSALVIHAVPDDYCRVVSQSPSRVKAPRLASLGADVRLVGDSSVRRFTRRGKGHPLAADRR